MDVLEERVRAAVASAFGADLAAVGPETSLSEDLGATSLAVLELLGRLEEELGIELPAENEFALDLRTVGDVVEAFAARRPR